MKLTGPQFKNTYLKSKHDKLSNYLCIKNLLVSYELEYKTSNLLKLDNKLSQYIEGKITELNNLRMDIEIALDKLPIQYQTVLKLKYVDGKTLREIGKIMNYCDKQVSRYHKEGLVLIDLIKDVK